MYRHWGLTLCIERQIVGCVSIDRHLGIQCGCGQTLMLSVGINTLMLSVVKHVCSQTLMEFGCCQTLEG